MLNKFFILLLIPFIATSVIAETVAYKLKGNLKIEGSTSI